MKGLNDIVINKKYAETLKVIQTTPEDLYTGTLAQIFIDDVNNNGGNITADDLKNYKVLEKVAIVNELGDLTLYTTPLPGGGSVLTHILNILQGNEI